MTPVQVLEAARELISEPSRWTKGDLARDVSGKSVYPKWDTAVCWCALGACEKVADNTSGEIGACRFLERACGRDDDYTAIVRINDNGNHATIVDLFTRAIALAKAAAP